MLNLHEKTNLCYSIFVYVWNDSIFVRIVFVLDIDMYGLIDTWQPLKTKLSCFPQ